MATTKKIVEDLPYNHWDAHKFCAYIYDDVLDEPLLSHLARSVSLHFKQDNSTYGTHRTTFYFGGNKHRIVKHHQNARYQQFIYDLTFEKEWWYQTTNTVKSWADNFLKTQINPAFYRYLTKIWELEPFCQEKEKWIPYRWHMNVLEYQNFLACHLDTSSEYFNTKKSSDARTLSVTFYLEDHAEGYGGEFYTLNGFVYKPKRNSAIAINGGQVYHGVNANLKPDKKPRYAFTTRWAHVDDLYLPGHPDKTLYKTEWS